MTVPTLRMSAPMVAGVVISCQPPAAAMMVPMAIAIAERGDEFGSAEQNWGWWCLGYVVAGEADADVGVVFAGAVSSGPVCRSSHDGERDAHDGFDDEVVADVLPAVGEGMVVAVDLEVDAGGVGGGGVVYQEALPGGLCHGCGLMVEGRGSLLRMSS